MKKYFLAYILLFICLANIASSGELSECGGMSDCVPRKPFFIKLDSAPPRAEVFLNNEKAGITPVKLRLEPKNNHILVSQDKLKTIFFQIVEGRLSGSVLIDSNPPGVDISLYHKIAGKTPLRIKSQGYKTSPFSFSDLLRSLIHLIIP